MEKSRFNVRPLHSSDQEARKPAIPLTGMMGALPVWLNSSLWQCIEKPMSKQGTAH